MLKSFSMLAVLIASTPALAGSPAVADAKAKDPKRKICVTEEDTGSRISARRICKTAEQWEAQREGDRFRRPDKAIGEGGGR